MRIDAIASLVTKNAKVVDIGTDHAYLPIYLYENGITKDITATDISANVLKYSQKNIKNANLEGKIKVIQSDGFEGLKELYDEAIITGMGAYTIIEILKSNHLPKSLVLCPHNNHYELRKFLQSINYLLEKEIVIKDKNKFYIIMKYQKGTSKLTEEELLFGINKNQEYLNYIHQKYHDLYCKSKNPKYLKYQSIIEKILE